LLKQQYFRNRVRRQSGKRRSGWKWRCHERWGHGGDGRQHGDSDHRGDCRIGRKHPNFRRRDHRGRHYQRRRRYQERRHYQRRRRHDERRLPGHGWLDRKGRDYDVRRSHGNGRQHGQRGNGGQHGHGGKNCWHHGHGWI